MANLSFVMSGLFVSLERDEAADLVKKYGGRVTTSLSKKTNYFVVGDDAGLAKLAKAEDLRVPTLTEDDLLDLIRKKSGLFVKQSPKKEPKNERPQFESKVKALMEEHKSPKKELSASVKPQKKEPMLTPQKTGATPPKMKSTSPPKPKVKIEPGQKLQDLQIERTVSEYQKDIASEANQAWVEKYKPVKMKDIIGQQGAASNCVK